MQAPRINQKVEFKVLHGPYASAFSTYVEDVDERAIAVVRPLIGGQPLPLVKGEVIRLEYSIENTARVAFPTRVVGLEVRVLPVVLLSYPRDEQVESFQQREYVRLQAVLELNYVVSFMPGRVGRVGGMVFTRTRDISGNGAQVLCPSIYPPGTQLNMNISVGEYLIHVVGQVIRQTPQPGTRDFWTGVRFVGIDDKDRELIVRWIFEKQRQQLQRGLL